MTIDNSSSKIVRGGLSVGDLLQLLEPFRPLLRGSADQLVVGVQQDSRRVERGDLFVARSGGKLDGRQFIDAALQRGAAAILTDGDTSNLVVADAPVICVTDARRASAYAAEAVLGFPSKKLSLIGITGTNGKTTTVALVERALVAVGARPARLGTTGFAFGSLGHESNLTTPEADEVSRLISRVVEDNGSHFIMEVSSHALDQGRVDALSFDVAGFSNLTQDHLDHHGDMASYEAAKQRLFTDRTPAKAVINVDDAAGRRFAGLTRANQLIRVGRSQPCDVQPLDVSMSVQGIRGDIRVDNTKLRLETRLVGEHNLDNILLAIGILHALGVELQTAVDGFAGDFGVPGRLERCDGMNDDIIALVDYAHTPDALERVLQAVKRFATGSVHCVFGCGGDRDPNKRPKMGRAVGRWSDRATITNDNPRTEEPELIAAAIEPGLSECNIPYRIQLDRALAIRDAILEAAPGDVIVIAGKGHEPYQIVGTTKKPFDDREQARLALAIRRTGSEQRKGGCC